MSICYIKNRGNLHLPNTAYGNDVKKVIGNISNISQLSEKEKIILKMLKETPEISLQKVSAKSGIGYNTVWKLVTAMREKGIIERIGSRKEEYWKIIEN